MTDTAPVWLERAVRLYDHDGIGDGDIITRDWLLFALDIPQARRLEDVERLQWMTLERVEALKSYLLEDRKVALRPIRGQGYQVIPPAQQAEFAVREAMSQMRKGMERGQKLLHHTRTEVLSHDERKRHTDACVRMAGIKQMLTRERKSAFALFAPRPVGE